MSNKINSGGEHYPPPVARTGASRAAASAAAAGKAATPTAPVPAQPPRGDAVSLTADAQLLQQAQAAVAKAPDIDQKRVDEVRQALADGSYRADAKTIAARLLKTEWEIYSR